MKIQIDIKSLLCGAILGVLGLLVTGAGTTPNPAGKYQITGVGNGTGGWGYVMLDTQSGEAWGLDCTRSSISTKTDKFFDVK
jgi:hypothetical protein